MVIDLSMNDFKIPKLYQFDYDFGQMKQSGGLTTAEVATNVAMPFEKERAYVISENSSTSDIYCDARFSIDTNGVTLTLGDPKYKGCTITVFGNMASGASATVIYKTRANVTKSQTIAKNNKIEFVSLDGHYFVPIKSGSGSGSVSRFSTLVEAQTALAIPEGSEGYIPDNGIVIVDELNSYVTGEER